jgi:hypothetical protein
LGHLKTECIQVSRNFFKLLILVKPLGLNQLGLELIIESEESATYRVLCFVLETDWKVTLTDSIEP